MTVPRNTDAAKRGPRYVSPNSASLRTTVKTVNGQPPTSTQVPQNPSTTALSTAQGGNCTVTPAGETCTVTIPTPTGTVVYQFDLLDSNNNVLATNTVTFTIAAGSNNPALAAQLDGVVATVTVTAPNLQPGTSFSGPITVNAYDASGALIVGAAPFANPFTLTDTDGTTHTSLTDGSTTGKSVTDGEPERRRDPELRRREHSVVLDHRDDQRPDRRRRQRASRKQPNALAGPDADTDSDTGWRDADADSHPDSHPDGDAGRRHADADPHSDRDADGNAYAHADSDADADAHAHAHAHADAHADTDPHAHTGPRRARREPEPGQRERLRREQQSADHRLGNPVSGTAFFRRVRHVQPGGRHDRDRHDLERARTDRDV